MTKLKKITGLWRGRYDFDLRTEHPELQLTPANFLMNLRQRWFGFFKGTVEDDAQGMSGLGTIMGRFSYPSLRFVKRMPIGYALIPGGRKLTMREYLREHGLTYDREIAHRPILYTGQFIDEARATGRWIITAGPISLPDGQNVQGVETTGTWSLERAS